MSKLLRPGVWSLLVVILAIDAAIGTPISLGLLYFAPLALAALRLTRLEAVAMIVLCASGRVLFGPAGDPLGLDSITVRLPVQWVAAANVMVSITAFSFVGSLLMVLSAQRQKLVRLSQENEHDPLTGVGNRRYLQKALRRQAIGRQDVAALALDIDHFKRINDTWGHDTGDRVLRELARRITETVRTGDVVARTGGEEFVVMLPAGSIDQAMEIGTRIAAAVRSSPFDTGEARVPVTVSVGIATGAPSDALLARADTALYAAKHGGRDRVELAAA